MDVAGKVLDELLRARPVSFRILEDIRSGSNSIDEYYLLDRLGETQQGTSLHRLLASSLCTSDALEAFIGHARAATHAGNNCKAQETRHQVFENGNDSFARQPPIARHQNCHGATALHVAMYRNPMRLDNLIRLLLDWDASQQSALSLSFVSLASIPMRCGSYPLHILAGQNLTINEKALKLLVHADPSVILKEDINGDNVLSLLWKNCLRFRWAGEIMDGASYIEYMDDKRHKACSWMTVITPSQFLQCSSILVRNALGGGAKTMKGTITIHDLCGLQRCPPMLLLMAFSPRYNAILGIKGAVHTLDEEGRLPLHHAVQSLPATYQCVPDHLHETSRKSVVQLLLDYYPEGARVKDRFGRLPLHYALENGCLHEQDLMRLVDLYPDALRAQDPISSLYPFMLVSPRGHKDGHKKSGASTSNTVCMEWKKDHVRISFLLLSLCPEALQYHQNQSSNGFVSLGCS